MPRDVQIAGAAGAAPQSYTVPNATEIIPRAVRATFNGVAAGTAFAPTVQIISDGGVLIAEVATDTTVAAGGSASVTFAPFLRPFGASGGCCSTANSTYGTVVASTSPRGFWKFNESAGGTAADSSGNGYTLTVQNVGPPGLGSWAWAQTAGPPGDQTVLTQGAGPRAFNNAFPAKSDNFAAAAWVDVTAQFFLQPAIMRQGDPDFIIANGGWHLYMDSGTGLWTAEWSNGAAMSSIVSNVAGTVGTFALVGWQVQAGTASMWINGVKQTATAAATILAAGGITFADSNNRTFYLRGGLSWSFVWDRPLTAAEWAGLAAPGGNVPAGWLLQSTGAGGSTYAPLSSGTATAGWTLHADGLGGTYWGP